MISVKEPNLVAEQPITVELMKRQRRSLEEYARFGWQPGLISLANEEASLDLRMDELDVISLYGLHAVGEKGHPLFVGGASGSPRISLDVGSLGVGRYNLYLCLAKERKAMGEVVEFRSPTTGMTRKFRADLDPSYVLELDKNRLKHQDWLKVAVFDRCRESGVVKTHLDQRFHPPVNDLKAYSRPNPLPSLIEQLLDDEAVKQQGPLPAMTRSMLKGLRAIATQGSPETVYLQTQICLELVRELDGDAPLARSGLQGTTYSPQSFSRFLNDIQDSLVGSSRPLFPEVLEIQDTRYLRTGGEFQQEGDFWVWRPERPGFVASGLALYLPHAGANMPWIGHGHHKDEAGDWPLAKVVDSLSHPGAAIVAENIDNHFDKIYLRTNSMKEAQNLRLKLGEGHAVYYF